MYKIYALRLKKVAFVFLQEEEENMLTILEFFKLFFMVRSFPSNSTQMVY